MLDLGRKFEVEDMTIEIYDEVVEYTRNYSGTFEFMLDMQAALKSWGELTPGQTKGVANCMRAEMLRNQHRTIQAAMAPITDGMYRKDGIIYKVQAAVHGSGNLYAKQLVKDDYSRSGWRFEYVAGAVRKLLLADKMTLEQAKEFGALYGTCCVCGRTLTDETSIEMGIGPICAGRF